MVNVMKMVKRRDCISINELPIFQKVKVLKRPIVKRCDQLIIPCMLKDYSPVMICNANLPNIYSSARQ